MAVGFRSVLKRVRKPAVMALVAGSLALSLTVTTTTKAEALAIAPVAPVIAAAEGVLAGGVRLALPSLLSVALATTPVGWVVAGGLAIGALGVGLYASRDYWLPFVAGAFGQGGTNEDVPAGQGSYTWAGMKLSKPKLEANPRDVSAVVTYTGPTLTGANYASVSAAVKCKNTNTGVVTTQMLSSSWGVTGSFLPSTTSYFSCPSGNTALGAVVGAYGAAPELGASCYGGGSGHCRYMGPGNVTRWGDQVTGTPGFDPKGADVKYNTTVECIDDGGMKSTISAEWFGNEGGMKVPSCAAAGKGHGTGKMSVDGFAPTAPGVPGTVSKPIWETQAPATDPDHPLCGPQRPGPGCEMKIVIDGKPCTVGAWECENWTDIWRDPNTAPRVGCSYGPYALAVDLCKVMEPAYRPGGAPANEANMDADPATRNYTQPGGQVHNPPATGTGTGVVPGGAATSAPPGSTPAQAECFPSGWAMLNPVEWVMKPVGCALDAAFKPKKDVQTRISTMQGQFSNKVPVSWFGGDIANVSGGSCPTNWAVTFQGKTYPLICGSEADSIIRGFRPVLGAMLITAALWPLVRSLFYASIPILKVNPS